MSLHRHSPPHRLVRIFAAAAAFAAVPTLAADVTPARLANPEPQNWLMNHRTYDGQRFSPLARINRDTVKNLKLAYAVPLGGGAGKEFNEATPLAEDGFLYITDSWGVLYKIDGTSGDVGRIVWRMDPKQEQQRQNRGAALWGNLVITAANSPGRVIATNKETGKVVWETAFPDIASVVITMAPLAIKDKIIVGAANSGAGIRDWIAALDAATGKRMKLQIALLIALAAATPSIAAEKSHWVVSWGASPAPQLADPAQMRTAKLEFDNQTLREVVHISIGSTTVRVRLSKAYGKDAVEVGAAHIALREQANKIVSSSDRALTFGGRPSVEIPPNALVLSDPVNLDVPDGGDLAISIFIPGKTTGAGVHYAAQQTSYIGPGILTTAPSIDGATTITSWVFLTGVDVLAPQSASALVASATPLRMARGPQSMPIIDGPTSWPPGCEHGQAPKSVCWMPVSAETGSCMMRVRVYGSASTPWRASIGMCWLRQA